MKKLILIMAIVLMAVPCLVASPFNIWTRPTADWLTGSMPNKDPAWAWMKWMDGIAGTATSGTPYFVDSVDGDDDYDGLTWERAKETIQAAVDLVDGHDSIYIRGVFTEAVTTAIDDPDVKLIGVSDGMISPAWLSGATGSSALTLRSLNWQVANIYFQGAGNTVPLIDVRRDGSNLATGTVIVNCSFHGVGGSHSAIRLYGGVVQAKIYGCRFADFYGVAHGAMEATVYNIPAGGQAAVHVDVIGNIFVDNLDALIIQGVGCVIKGNVFTKTGHVQDTTTVINTVAAGGAGGANIITENTFDSLSAEMTVANGYIFNTEDAVAANYCLDGIYPKNGKAATEYYVDSANGHADNSGLSWGQAVATIQQGVDLMTDHSTLYVGGVAYTEAVTLPVGIERGRIIGVCKANQIPFWQSGATDAVHLTINRGEWEVANFRFFSSVATVAHVTISKAGGSSIIRDCWFSGNGSESGIEAVGPGGAPTDIKILRNRFSGFVTTNALEGAICGTNYDDSGAVVWEIIGNTFADNTKNINLLALSCRIEGNTFTTSATAAATTVIISTRAGVGGVGAGGGNAVVGNYFPHESWELNTTNGYLASTNDTWAGNYCTDGKMNTGIPHYPRYFTVTADFESATWNTSAAHEIAEVTGAVRMQIMIQCTEDCVTTSNDGTLALGFAGNTADIIAATDIDGGAGDVNVGIVQAVYAGTLTSSIGGAEGQSALTHSIFDVVVVGGVDVGYTIGTNAATDGILIFHVWWEPIDATGLAIAGAGGAF